MLIEHFTETVKHVAPSAREAKKLVTDTLNIAIDTGIKEGTYDLPYNMGDVILGHAETHSATARHIAERVRHSLPVKQKEGVTDDDVRGWWNSFDVERRMVLQMEEGDRMATYLSLVTTNTPGGDPAKRLWQIYPRYGNPEDTSIASGDDRPLPIELKQRIHRFVDRQLSVTPAPWQAETFNASSLNALIREKMRAGLL